MNLEGKKGPGEGLLTLQKIDPTSYSFVFQRQQNNGCQR